ncbi:uncharacterized protein [Haliotis cracherodii]|uniref:uncharacterized protein isoform X2 n=1 Tax=Haliotis cracherodii TaxID=6455 RepID=UPI0039E913AC
MAVTVSTAVQIILILLGLSSIARGKSSKKFILPGPDCNQDINDIEGAEVVGKGTTAYMDRCEVNLSTGSHDHWMFHASDMSLMSCLVSVKLYDRRSASSHPLFHFRCASPDPGIVRMNTSFVRLVLKHNNRTNFHFKITFTARKPAHKCDDFLCQNKYCISKDLLCDGTNNCFDRSDESENSTAYCIKYDPFPGENFAVLISVVGGSIVMGIIAFCCRMLRRRRQQHYLEEDMDDFANGPYVKKYAYMYAVIRPQQRTRRNQHRSRSKLRHVDHSVDEPEF